MKNIMISFFVILTALLSCEKSTIPPDPPDEKESIYEPIWTAELDPKKEVITLSSGVLVGDEYIHSVDCDDGYGLFRYDAKTGKKLDKIMKTGQDQFCPVIAFENNGNYISISNTGIVSLNPSNEKVDWQFPLKSNGYISYVSDIVSNNELYHNPFLNFNKENQESRIVKIDLESGENTIIKSFPNDDGKSKSVSPPAFYRKNNGDEFMIVNFYPDFSDPPRQSTQDLMAIDLSSNKTIWKVESIVDSLPSNSLIPPVIYENVVITGAQGTLFAYEVNTGKFLWKRELVPNGLGVFLRTHYLLVGNKLFVNPIGEEVFCLDPTNGEIVWQNLKGGANCNPRMLYYEKEDLLVFNSWGYKSIMILDATTGEVLHRQRDHLGSNFMAKNVVYSPELDMFYTSTFTHVHAFKLKRPE